ncbi:hypothetical protein Leryth_011752 [Lithospermum erythrorhizon]|nr:hypothetical protein Leryth_011752 [Lithospermum erythrorhizon]
MGTYGYAAPEYLSTGHLSSKSDVYSFGVVLLEMLSGKRAVDKNRPTGEQNLVGWAKRYLANKRKLFRVLDNRLEGQYTVEVAHKVAVLSLRCLSMDPRLRPSMADVVKELVQVNQSKDAANARSKSSNENRPRRRSSGDAKGNKSASVAYPKPSDSLFIQSNSH